MEQRNLSALLVCMAILLVWGQWRQANRPKVELDQPVAIEAPAGTDDLPATLASSVPAAPRPAAPHAEPVPHRVVSMEACGAQLRWDTRTGSASALELPEWEAPQTVNAFWKHVVSGALFSEGLAGWEPYHAAEGPETLASDKAQLLSMGSGGLDTPSAPARIVDEGPSRVGLTGVTQDNIEVTRHVAASQTEPCVFDVQLSWTNRSTIPFSGGLWVGVHDAMGGAAGYYANVVRPHAMTDDHVEVINKLEKLETPDARSGAVQWFGLSDRYFVAALIPDPTSTGRLRFSQRFTADGEPIYGEHFVITEPLAPGATHTETLRLYAGPMDATVMGQVAPNLAKLVSWQYGWFAFFCFILLSMLRTAHSILGNWGLAIIALTVFVKGVTFPLTQASFRSGQAMQAIQPQLQEIRETYKDEPEKLNQEMLRLFQENGVNPVGGCLPMLIQMPVWFALFRVLLSSVDLYHTNFLYLTDLSVADPYMVLPILAMVTTLAQQRMMPQPGNMDPNQARMLKAMPLVFGFFYFAFPAGLVLYIFVNMLLTTAQQWLIRRQFASAASAVAPN